jgi:hypothetical protein
VVRLFTEVLRDQRRRRYKDDFRVIHFSIQSNHLHLIVEADTERAKGRYEPLRSGVSGLEIAFARRLNRMLRRKGKVWADRYHRRDLKTPTETAIGLSYVFNNYTRARPVRERARLRRVGGHSRDGRPERSVALARMQRPDVARVPWVLETWEAEGRAAAP